MECKYKVVSRDQEHTLHLVHIGKFSSRLNGSRLRSQDSNQACVQYEIGIVRGSRLPVEPNVPLLLQVTESPQETGQITGQVGMGLASDARAGDYMLPLDFLKPPSSLAWSVTKGSLLYPRRCKVKVHGPRTKGRGQRERAGNTAQSAMKVRTMCLRDEMLQSRMDMELSRTISQSQHSRPKACIQQQLNS